MEEKKSKFERIIILIGGMAFGLASVWLGFKIFDFALTFSSIKIILILIFCAMFVIGCGTFVIVSSYRPKLIAPSKISEHKKKLDPATIMIVSSIIVILLMALYIYFSNGLGGK